MDIPAAERLKNLGIEANPKTQAELEMRWQAMKDLKNNIHSEAKNDFDICVVNTAGGDHVK